MKKGYIISKHNVNALVLPIVVGTASKRSLNLRVVSLTSVAKLKLYAFIVFTKFCGFEIFMFVLFTIAVSLFTLADNTFTLLCLGSV